MPSIYTATPNAGAAAAAASAATAPPKDKNAVDKDMFLKLLVAQLKYQDPLHPTDPNEFLAQTAQFTSVEKLTQIADETAKTALGQRMTTASSLIGKAVTYTGDGATDTTGTVQSARITDTGDIMLNVGGGKELSLLEVKVVSLPGAATSSTPGGTATG
jgi:flagellar basal-body rod modification protein FlgD